MRNINRKFWEIKIPKVIKVYDKRRIATMVQNTNGLIDFDVMVLKKYFYSNKSKEKHYK